RAPIGSGRWPETEVREQPTLSLATWPGGCAESTRPLGHRGRVAKVPPPPRAGRGRRRIVHPETPRAGPPPGQPPGRTTLRLAPRKDCPSLFSLAVPVSPEPLQQPRPDISPLAVQRPLRHAQHFSSLGRRQSAEIAQEHDLRLHGVLLFELVERLMNGKHI